MLMAFMQLQSIQCVVCSIQCLPRNVLLCGNTNRREIEIMTMTDTNKDGWLCRYTGRPDRSPSAGVSAASTPGEDFFARRRCKHPSDPEKMLHLLNPTSLPNYKNINVNTNWQLSNIPVIETMQNMARIECHILTRFEKRFELVASLEWATDLHANEICPRWSVEKPVARLSEGKRKTEEKLK